MKPDDENSKQRITSKRKTIIRFSQGSREEVDDVVSIEEPIEISLSYGPTSQRKKFPLAVTMRTPGHDFELATGFLFTEGIISSKNDIANIRYTSNPAFEPAPFENYLQVDLSPDLDFDEKQLSRHFYTASSCGVCGKSSIELVNKQSIYILNPLQPIFNSQIFLQLPNELIRLQRGFKSTGGIHAAALFNNEGHIIKIAEDVGRHNAMDKMIGMALKAEYIPLYDYGILVSGRTSFELVQKAWMAGVPLVAGVGAPSSLAIDLAEEAGMTLIGFLKDHKYNIYCGFDRLKR